MNDGICYVGMLLVFVFYLCLLERWQHTHTTVFPKKKKSDTEMCRHTGTAHSHAYNTPLALLDRFVVVAGYHPVLYGAAPLLR